jgi:hypothetical protein
VDERAGPYPREPVNPRGEALSGGRTTVEADGPRGGEREPDLLVFDLRATEEPSVSTPVTWDEVDSGADLRFGPDEVRERVERHGDLLEPLLTLRQKLP